MKDCYNHFNNALRSAERKSKRDLQRAVQRWDKHILQWQQKQK